MLRLGNGENLGQHHTAASRIITARPASDRLRPPVARAGGHATSVVSSTVVRWSVRCASKPPRQIGGSKRCDVEIVKRSEAAKGFTVLPNITVAAACV